MYEEHCAPICLANQKLPPSFLGVNDNCTHNLGINKGGTMNFSTGGLTKVIGLKYNDNFSCTL